MCAHIVLQRQAAGFEATSKQGQEHPGAKGCSHISRSLHPDQRTLGRQSPGGAGAAWQSPQVQTAQTWRAGRWAWGHWPATVLPCPAGVVTPPTCKSAQAACQWGRIQPAYTQGLLHSAYRRCLGTLCSQRRKTHLQRVIHRSLKSEPSGSISTYPSSFPPKMQQNKLLFIFFINYISPVPQKYLEGRKKKRGGIAYLWCKAALAMGFKLWQGWGGKGEKINGMAVGSADDCIWTELFPAQDYRSRAGISLQLLFLAVANVCTARLGCGRKTVLSVLASSSSSIAGTEAAQRQQQK